MEVSNPHNESEDTAQQQLCSWFRFRYPGVRIFAVPNGGKRSLLTAIRLKNTGVSPGVPDLYIPAWHLWIEMKRAKGGQLSAAQKDWHEYLRSIGDTVIVGRGFLDAKEQIALYRSSP